MTFSDKLGKPMQELAKSITKTSSKMREFKTYDEIINNQINKNRWQEAIDEELWNLDSYQIWNYTTLSPGRQLIGCK